MPEPITLLIALAGIVLVGFVFTTIDVLKDVGRTIGLVLLVVMLVLMSDRIIPWFRQQNFSFDRLPNLRNLNPFATRVAQPGWQDLPYLLSNETPPVRPVPIVPPPSRPPSGTSSATNSPQTVEPYENQGIAPPPPIVPPYSSPAPPAVPPTVPAPPGTNAIPGLW